MQGFEKVAIEVKSRYKGKKGEGIVSGLMDSESQRGLRVTCS